LVDRALRIKRNVRGLEDFTLEGNEKREAMRKGFRLRRERNVVGRAARRQCVLGRGGKKLSYRIRHQENRKKRENVHRAQNTKRKKTHTE